MPSSKDNIIILHCCFSLYRNRPPSAADGFRKALTNPSVPCAHSLEESVASRRARTSLDVWMFKHHNVGGYIRVFDRGIGCLICHWTDDILYRDTTAAGRGIPTEHDFISLG